jgi:nucleoside-diphosphate-sugar epimerase
VRIAITGHTAGIGKALAETYSNRGHEIVGLSQRDGNDIRNTRTIADLIDSCDMFINNAQVGYAQTELLFEMASRWANTKKTIMIISTMMTQDPVSVLPGLDMDHYRIQKVALEQAVHQIRNRRQGPYMIIVRPGDIATHSDKTVPPSADPTQWAQTLVTLLNAAADNGLRIPDISLGPA